MSVILVKKTLDGRYVFCGAGTYFALTPEEVKEVATLAGLSAGAEDMSGKQLLEKFSEYTRAIPMGAFNSSNGASHYNWASYHHRILAGMLGMLQKLDSPSTKDVAQGEKEDKHGA